MKIVFTQFTPPFEHGMTEMEYIQYDDWYSKLRRAFAATEEVVFISLTKEKDTVHIKHDGYTALFFPVVNPEARQRSGRMWYRNEEICAWLKRYRPDVIHIIGSGSEMGLEILRELQEPLTFLWERCTVKDNVLNWPELQLCDYYVHPTDESINRARNKVPSSKLLRVPLGADTETFKSIAVEKQFDIITIGRLTPSKQIDRVQNIVVVKDYSWIHAGGYVKGRPYSRVEDLLFARKLRRLFARYPIKNSFSGRMCSGIFPHDQMPMVYNKARIMVHPSKGEGAARAVQEALSCEVPVIVLKEVVPWVESEFGIALDSIEQLDEALSELLADPERAIRMGENGRKWLLEKHSFSHLYETVKTYHKLQKSESIGSASPVMHN